MKKNLINLPAAFVSIIFRKIIDTHFGTKSHRIMTRGQWSIQEYIGPGLFYLYLIGSAFSFLGKHIKNGTIVNLTKKANSATRKYMLRKRWLKRNRSWALQNLLGNKENQEKALTYLAAQIPNQAVVEQQLQNIDDEAKKINLQTSPNKVNEFNKSCSSFYSVVEDGIGHRDGNVIENSNEISNENKIGGETGFENKNTNKIAHDTTDDIKKENAKNDDQYKNLSMRNLMLKDNDSVYMIHNAKGDFPNQSSIDNLTQEQISTTSSRNFSLSTPNSSDFAIYTPSVIREIIPSECSETELDTFKIPERRKRFKWRKVPTRKRKSRSDSIEHNSMYSQGAHLHKTRSGRIYGN